MPFTDLIDRMEEAYNHAETIRDRRAKIFIGFFVALMGVVTFAVFLYAIGEVIEASKYIHP